MNMLEELEPKITPLQVESKYGKFAVEPLERGFGHTLGNAFRRVLLAHLQGAAITDVRIEGVVQEFTTLPGVLEDSTEIMLNLKELAIRVDPDVPAEQELKAEIDLTGEREANGADITAPPEVHIMNPEHHIAHLTAKDAKLHLEMWVRRGVGYLPVEQRDRQQASLDVIPLDALFSPVPRATYSVEPTRKGSRTDLDRLILEVWTDGTLEPQEAIRQAALLLHQYLDIFAQVPAPRLEAVPADMEAGAPGYDTILDRPIEELDFSVRTYNCLKKEGLNVLRALVQRTPEDLLDIRNFGKRSLEEVVEKLSGLGLELASSAAASES
ncbi:MAG: DNA-directed RNA polymerase subunit alpha [candidate division WS1 bacterium]|jgi:DNA-directed RNA polymerase subunit alpha|nr:DNA-directed RNA polymerase subunit alpha [candidate division WS1 bacterium]